MTGLGEMTMDEALQHYGVKGMKWGRRKSDSPTPTSSTRTYQPRAASSNDTRLDSPEFKKKSSRGKKIAIGLLLVTGAVLLAVAIRKTKQEKAAQEIIKSKLADPFAWKDAAGDWHRYEKVNGLWKTR